MALILSGDTGPSFVQSAAMPTGSVLQTVNATTTSNASTSSTSYVTTGFSASITPKFSTSKILVLVSGTMYSNGNGLQSYITVYRGGTNIGGNGVSICYAGSTTSQSNASVNLLDSPATTSSTTYTVYLAASSGSTVYFNVANSLGASTASMTLIEIAG
jgi:hypothetical protein